MMWVAVIACAAVASVFFFAMVSQKNMHFVTNIVHSHQDQVCVPLHHRQQEEAWAQSHFAGFLRCQGEEKARGETPPWSVRGNLPLSY